jgi:lipoyl(octanoyl) transferase
MTEPIVQHLGVQDYRSMLERMHHFTDSRSTETTDELWLLQHPPVYTLGQAGDHAHVLDAAGIDVVSTDRGGQVTYHGPGQLIIYLLVDLRRGTLGVRSLVETMENAVIELLSRHGVESNSRRDAPGVYVREKKIAALGLRVRRGCTFHGLSLNVDMDLTPFNGINPCGYAGLAVTQLKDEGIDLTVEQAGEQLSTILIDAITPDNKADQ